MSLPDYFLPVPVVDAFCCEHEKWFDSYDGCRLCRIDNAGEYADERLQDRLEGR